jgi:hypothetical protein
MKKGWWFLNIAGIEKLKEEDIDNICKLIKEGYQQGVIIEEE